MIALRPQDHAELLSACQSAVESRGPADGADSGMMIVNLSNELTAILLATLVASPGTITTPEVPPPSGADR